MITNLRDALDYIEDLQAKVASLEGHIADLELQLTDRFEEGLNDGYARGHDEGFEEGLMLGNEEGYEIGYKDGFGDSEMSRDWR